MTGQPARAAVVVPGGTCTADGPLLAYAAQAARRRGATVHRITRSPPPRAATTTSGTTEDTYRDWVASQVTHALAQVAAHEPVLLAKSPGSLSAPLAAGRGLAAIWFTPLLTDPPTAEALRRATAVPADRRLRPQHARPRPAGRLGRRARSGDHGGRALPRPGSLALAQPPAPRNWLTVNPAP
jgi:hypothetical protein